MVAMSLSCTCPSCARTMQVSETEMGTRIKCPQCSATIQVPVSAPEGGESEGYALGPTCPKCKRDLEKGAVLCIACGFNLKTGKKLVPVIKESEYPIGPRRLGMSIIR